MLTNRVAEEESLIGGYCKTEMSAIKEVEKMYCECQTDHIGKCGLGLDKSLCTYKAQGSLGLFQTFMKKFYLKISLLFRYYSSIVG